MLDTDTMHELTKVARDEAGDEAHIRTVSVQTHLRCQGGGDEVSDQVTVHLRLTSDNDLWAWLKWNASRRIDRDGGTPDDLTQIVREVTRDAIESTRRRCLEKFGPEYEDAS